MAIGPKTRRYLASKQNPSESVSAFMQSMEAMAEETALHVIQETVGSHKDALAKELEKEVKKALADFPALLRSAMKAKLDSMPHLKGEAGYTPVKGMDYEDGIDGKTPIPGIDYFSRTDTRKLVAEFATAAFERMKREGMTKEEMKKCMEDMVSTSLVPVDIARALETLSGADRLDYEALKNRPGVPVQDTRQHTLHRGAATGKQTYYYDLSDLCNGVDKTFAIPANTRVVAVSGTDAPGGIYRPLVDWTGTGTTTLTLTSQVAAPQAGATLYILYVV